MISLGIFIRLNFYQHVHNKQLLDEVFVISRITLIILNIRKTESNNCFIIP